MLFVSFCRRGFFLTCIYKYNNMPMDRQYHHTSLYCTVFFFGGLEKSAVNYIYIKFCTGINPIIHHSFTIMDLNRLANFSLSLSPSIHHAAYMRYLKFKSSQAFGKHTQRTNWHHNMYRMNCFPNVKFGGTQQGFHSEKPKKK